jgi:hypothetical protein
MPLESEIKYDDGVYFGKPVSMVSGYSSKDTPQIVAEFTITHIAHDGQWVEVQQANRRVYLYTSDAAWPNTSKRLEVLGFNGDFNHPDFSDTVKAEGVSLACKIEEYQGKSREKWDINGSGGGEVKPLPADKARQLSARWKNEHPAKMAVKSAPKAAPKSSGPTAPASAPGVAAQPVGTATGKAPGEEVTEEDIPF